MSATAFERLRDLVLDDPDLVERLAAVPRPEFAAALVDVAAELGLDVTLDDVDEAMKAARRAWLERWL